MEGSCASLVGGGNDEFLTFPATADSGELVAGIVRNVSLQPPTPSRTMAG